MREHDARRITREGFHQPRELLLCLVDGTLALIPALDFPGRDNRAGAFVEHQKINLAHNPLSPFRLVFDIFKDDKVVPGINGFKNGEC